MNQKLLLFGVVLLVLVGAGSYVLGTKKSQTPVQKVAISPTPTPDPAINWKTYNAKILVAESDLKKAGLSSSPMMSIRYPFEWSINPLIENQVIFTENNKQYKVRFNEAGMGLPPNPNITSTDEKISVNQYTGNKKIFKDKSEIFLMAIDIGNEYFRTNIIFDVPSTNQEKYLQIFDQILSTFEFTP